MNVVSLADYNVKNENKFDNIIVIRKPEETKKYNADGSLCMRRPNVRPGVSEEVFPLSDDEITRLFSVMEKKIENAGSAHEYKCAMRNKLMLTIGFNSGLRASDLRLLTWEFFFNENGEFRDFYTVQPQKTKKYKKFVKIFFNDAIKNAIRAYIKEFPINNYSDLIFASAKGNDAVTVHAIYDIIKKASKEAGITKNIGSHSMRKTWGSMAWHNAQDKEKALVVLQNCFNHSSSIVTARYIGIMDEDMDEMFNSVQIG